MSKFHCDMYPQFICTVYVSPICFLIQDKLMYECNAIQNHTHEQLCGQQNAIVWPVLELKLVWIVSWPSNAENFENILVLLYLRTILILREHIFRLFLTHSPTHYFSINTVLKVNKNWHFATPPSHSYCWHNVRMVPYPLWWTLAIIFHPSSVTNKNKSHFVFVLPSPFFLVLTH